MINKSTIRILMVNLCNYVPFNEHKMLVKEGFAVHSVNAMERAVHYLGTLHLDIIIINAYHNVKKGIQVCKELKKLLKSENQSIVMFSERVNENMLLVAYAAGADDYLFRSNSSDLWLVKLKKLSENTHTSHNIGNSNNENETIRIDREQYCVYVMDKKIYLPRLQFELLDFISSRPGNIFTYEEIEKKLYGKFRNLKSTKVYVSMLRKNLGIDVIKNIQYKGYIFNG